MEVSYRIANIDDLNIITELSCFSKKILERFRATEGENSE